MIFKDYYRLEELESKFSISKNDVLYLVEQNKIRLAFYRKAVNYLIGGWLNDGFIGYGAVNYEGMVTVQRDVGLKMFAKGKVDTINFQLCERDNINYLTGKYPFSIPLPNDFLCKWSAKSLEDIKWERIPARIYPSEGPSGMWMIADTLKTFVAIKSQGEKTEEINALTEQHYGQYPKKVLRGQSVTLNITDACVLRSDLDALGLMSIDPSTSRQNVLQNSLPSSALLVDVIQPSEPERLTEFDNDFDELLSKIMQANRGIKQKEIMRILTEEARSEEDTRKYDTRNILLDEVEGKIVWQDFGSTKQEKLYRSKTIANRLTEVRKLI
jgi:hypothetical protein